MDRALLTGSGVEGQPRGLASTPRTHTATVDATGTFDDLCAIEQALEDAEGSNTAWVMSATGKRTLRGRLKAADGSPILENGAIDGVAAVSTTACPDGSIFAGDWATGATVYSWGGPRVAIKSHGPSLFRAGMLQMRVIVEVDVLFSRPEQFCSASLA